jgi:hypothetical protein
VDQRKTPSHPHIPWHPAFVQAIKLELEQDKDALEFSSEYRLTSEPLEIDVVIIKKAPELTIEKNIARIFKRVNILEYKSPEDPGDREQEAAGWGKPVAEGADERLERGGGG